MKKSRQNSLSQQLKARSQHKLQRNAWKCTEECRNIVRNMKLSNFFITFQNSIAETRRKLNRDKEFCCRDIIFKYSSCKASKNCHNTRHSGRDINQTTLAKLCRDIAKLCSGRIQEGSLKICRDGNCMPRRQR